MTARKLLLRTGLPPGDVIMLTAAVRDLHRCHPGRFLTGVRTSSPALWEHNPWVVPLGPRTRGVEVIDCHYPLVDRSNEAPLHCLNGYAEFLSERLGVPIDITEFKGDVHVSSDEKQWFSQVHEITGEDTPFWIVAAGGKHDFTIKWWDTARYQEVVDHFRGRILFVQVGNLIDHHPPLRGVIDLRGRTDLRQLIRLVYHSQGVLSPVTSLMHLAAAVESRPDRPVLRPCVVVAGGREPSHWEAYPGHQFIHTIGALSCCATGGCWRSRTLPLGDGDRKDRPEELCEDVINGLPHCMHVIDATEVARRIELYYLGGHTRYLTPVQARVAEQALPTRRRQPPRTRPGSPANNGNEEAHRAGPAVTICVFTQGDRLEQVLGCLQGIRRCGERSRYRLVVGGEAVTDRVRRHLLKLQRSGYIDLLYLSPTTIRRPSMMRRMFRSLDTELVWWFDDDWRVSRNGALEEWLTKVRASPAGTVAWGREEFAVHPEEFAQGGDVGRWIRSARWYQGRPVPQRRRAAISRRRTRGAAAGDGRWRFLNGGSWMIRTHVLQALDWPDERLLLPGDDVLLGEAIRQHGWELQDIGSLGVASSKVPGRVSAKKRPGVIRRHGAQD